MGFDIRPYRRKELPLSIKAGEYEKLRVLYLNTTQKLNFFPLAPLTWKILNPYISYLAKSMP